VALPLAIILFLAGLFFIIKGGEFLVNAALSLNKHTGMNHILIGATFISIATALPEIIVSVVAVFNNNHAIATGNAIGSMIANIALVLGLYVAFMPGKIDRKQVLAKSIFLFVAMVVFWIFALNMRISWVNGTILILGFVWFMWISKKEAKKQKPTQEKPEESLSLDEKKQAWKKIFLLFLLAQGLLIAGAFMLVTYGEQIAHAFNISEAVIGFTIIAFGTTLPEIVTAIQAIKKKSGGLALGNVIGANIINATLLLGITSVISPGGLPISRATLFVSLPVLMGLTLIALVPMLVKQRAYKWQGVVLLGLYIAYILYLMIVQPL